MSEENVELVRRAYARFTSTGEFGERFVSPDFVWDMSTFRGWPEQQTYDGVDGARTFLRQWLEGWDDWSLEVDAVHDAGGRVVAVVRQHARSKASGLPVEMVFAQVWTIEDGVQTRMEMYADPAEALQAVGLEA